MRSSLTRLRSGTIQIKTKRYRFSGGLIEKFGEDEFTGESFIVLSGDMAILLENQTFTRMADRSKLGSSDITKWLHLYLSSQSATKNKPHRVSISKVHSLSGSSSSFKEFKRALKKALEQIVKQLPHFLESWSIEDNILFVTKQSFKKHEKKSLQELTV